MNGPSINKSPGALMAGAGVVPVSSASANDPIGPGAWSPRRLTNGEATPMTLGQVCYLSANDTVRLADANGTEAQATAVCICVETVAAGAIGRFVFGGAVDGAGAGKAFGQVAYLSTIAGAISATPDLTSGEFNVILGYWLNATDLQFAPQLPILN